MVEVSVEQHAQLHLAEYLTYGLWEDWLAYRGLSGIISHEECVSEAQSAAVADANRKRVWSDESRNKITQKNKQRGATIHCPDLNKTWLCANDAALELGLNAKVLYEYARGRKKGKYKGYTFIRTGQVEKRQ